LPAEEAPPPAARRRSLAPFDLRPVVLVRRISLFEREVREHLSQAALDALFARAEILSEGETSTIGGKRVFVGSTMLTCDMLALEPILREPADVGTASRLAPLLAKEPSLPARTQAIVKREVERLAHAQPKTVRGETRIRHQGTRVFLDIDVEALL
jgi:hypothetical protein